MNPLAIAPTNLPVNAPKSSPEALSDGLTVEICRGTNLARVGDHNQRLTLHAICVAGPATRSDLSLTTGLTAPAIAIITAGLVRQRLILQAGRIRGARGQPATRLVINPDGCYSIGLNADRDHITLVVVHFTGRVRARSS